MCLDLLRVFKKYIYFDAYLCNNSIWSLMDLNMFHKSHFEFWEPWPLAHPFVLWLERRLRGLNLRLHISHTHTHTLTYTHRRTASPTHWYSSDEWSSGSLLHEAASDRQRWSVETWIRNKENLLTSWTPSLPFHPMPPTHLVPGGHCIPIIQPITINLL